jgi:hypothetical protein
MLHSYATVRPLGLLPTVRIPDETLRRLLILEEFDLWFVEERVARDGSIAPDEIGRAMLEFRRYIALKLIGFPELAVPSDAVDLVWHAFLLFTRDYSEFCDMLGWGFIHHTPTTSRSSPRPRPSCSYDCVYERHFPAAGRGDGLPDGGECG